MAEKFYHLASFEFVTDVQIIKGKLESEGIAVFLRDENTLNSDPLISNAIGGVKLLVYEKDGDRATAIYNEVRAYAWMMTAAYSLPKLQSHEIRGLFPAERDFP